MSFLQKKSFSGLLLLSTCLYSLPSSAQICVENNTERCQELGYTEKSCSYGGVRCPYNTALYHCTQWTCTDGRYSETNDLSYTECISASYKNKTCYDCYCETTQTTCSVGDVYYADGSCSKKYASCIGKEPVGVVYAVTDSSGNILTNPSDPSAISSSYARVISLKDLTINESTYAFDPTIPFTNTLGKTPWGYFNGTVDNVYSYTSFYDDILSVDGQEALSDLYDGLNVTIDLVAKSSVSSCSYDKNTKNYALYCIPTSAQATTQFYPSSDLKKNSLVGAGHWYLPAMGELLHLYGFDPSKMTEGKGNSGSTGLVLSLVNQTLSDMKSRGFDAEPLNTNGYYHSVTSANTQYSWVVFFQDGTRSQAVKRLLSNGDGTRPYYLRASLQKGKITTPDKTKYCSIGDIYYSDGTCGPTSEYNSAKTAVGVVFMLTNALGNIISAPRSMYGRVINLFNLRLVNNVFNPDTPYGTKTTNAYSGNMYWGAHNTDLDSLTNYSTDTISTALTNTAGNEGSSELYDGHYNTLRIAEITGSNTGCFDGTYKADSDNRAKYCMPTAAKATLAFYPVNANNLLVGSNNWYLPAIGELTALYQAKSAVDTTLTFLAKQGLIATTLGNDLIKSSTEASSAYHLAVNMKDGSYSRANKSSSHNTRAVFEFKSTTCSNDYNLIECPIGGTCTSCLDGRTYYKLNRCNTGYAMSTDANTCEISNSCGIGDVFYADGTCGPAKAYDGLKTPIGIVYLLTDSAKRIVSTRSNHGRIVALNKLTIDDTWTFDPNNPYSKANNLSWGLRGVDISTLSNYGASNPATTALLSAGSDASTDIYSGKSNTTKIKNATLTTTATHYTECTDGTSPYVSGNKEYEQNCVASAVEAVTAYTPQTALNGTAYGSGNWYLMSFGELARLYGVEIGTSISYTGKTRDLVNQALAVLVTKKATSAKNLDKLDFMTSTEYSGVKSVIMNMNTSTVTSSDKDKQHPVWPSLEF